jgi:tetratricopeptide (TPR) repeat protein
MPPPRKSAVGLALACLMVAVSTFAQTPPRPDSAEDPASKDAHARFQEGLKRYEVGDFDGARIAFLQAYSVLHAVDILYNLSLSELRSGRPVEALHHLQEYMRDPRPTEEERARATKYVAEAHSRTGHVLVEAPPGAIVAMDDATVDKLTPLKEPIDVTVGTHVCSLRTGGKLQTAQVVARAGESVTVSFAGDEVKREAVGRPSGVVASPPSLPLGGSASRWPAAKIAALAAFSGASVGALALGLGYKVGQDNSRAEASALSARSLGVSCTGSASPPECAQADALKSDYDRDRTLSAVFFGAGAVCAAGALATVLLWPNGVSSLPRESRVAPFATRGGASLAWSGEF